MWKWYINAVRKVVGFLRVLRFPLTVTPIGEMEGLVRWYGPKISILTSPSKSLSHRPKLTIIFLLYQWAGGINITSEFNSPNFVNNRLNYLNYITLFVSGSVFFQPILHLEDQPVSLLDTQAAQDRLMWWMVCWVLQGLLVKLAVFFHTGWISILKAASSCIKLLSYRELDILQVWKK